MLSEEQINEWERSELVAGRWWRTTLAEMKELMLLGLQVKEGAKDAREVAARVFEGTDHLSNGGQRINKASELIAAFALKQRGEERSDE
jgi:hypothetical protein